MENSSKVCKKCGEEKDLNEFNKGSDKLGLRHQCKRCESDYRRKNRERHIKYMKKYYEENKEVLKEKNNIYIENNKEKVSKIKNTYYKNNKDKWKESLIRNKTKRLEGKKKYYKENKEKIKIWKKEYYNEIKNSPEYKERVRKNATNWRRDKPHIHAWRNILKRVMYYFGLKKQEKTIDILGYSPIDLKDHIEKLFKEGMSWENWGEWHIDHIKPVSKFDKDTHPSIVNSLDNLQPLWASENMSKSDKI